MLLIGHGTMAHFTLPTPFTACIPVVYYHMKQPVSDTKTSVLRRGDIVCSHGTQRESVAGNSCSRFSDSAQSLAPLAALRICSALFSYEHSLRKR